ncbi:MAG TPA: chemotaxis protein CheB [Thermoanaerobaculia bacterium]|nr:chemotaxis protein CheB [Thermoanaerobaculia bacterium]
MTIRKRKPAASLPAIEPVAPAVQDDSAFPIVGIGASAGGLEAFSELLRALPTDTGMAFVLVQHLSPSHPSQLADILSRTTRMPVTEVQDEPRVKPNQVYVIPPNRDMIILEGSLRLFPRKDTRGQHRPIDSFLRSLADDQGHRAIGAILSGTATDGTFGLQEIKAAGGITFAQDATAQNDSMPRSAVAAGCVDFVLPPAEIAHEIERIARHPYVAAPPSRPPDTSPEKPDFTEILHIRRAATGVDFTQYKTSTLRRRISRRIVLSKTDGPQPYARFLRNNLAELEALQQDILINVTSFFRDPETFEALKEKVFPQLFTDRARNQPLRVWVLGCSTGEEAYSLAMALTEFSETLGSDVPIQVFATDLNTASVEKARVGMYSKEIAHDVSPERLRRFFVRADGQYRVNKLIRGMCIFARHNVLSDPPFSQIDLLSCRNLLIYLGPALQQRVVPLLHYALKPSGYLMLGSSETIGSYRNLFEVEDAKNKIFFKKPGTYRLTFGLSAADQPARLQEKLAGPESRGSEMLKEADRILLARHVPPSVLIGANLDVLQFRGDTGLYLAPPSGKASFNVLKMAREGLPVALRSAINRAKKTQTAVREESLRVRSNGGYREVGLEVVPIQEGSFLIVFDEAAREPKAKAKTRETTPPPAAEDETLLQQNERLVLELAAVHEYLQSVIDQQEAANEELQSANEEVQSANEELQSINEELETSKEELQSSNEELTTVNDELHSRNGELNVLNNDLTNLLSSVQTAIVMLGPDLRVRRFTPMAEKLFNLIPADIGRPIAQIKLNVQAPDLEPLLLEVLDMATVSEQEVQGHDGRWYSLRFRPYKTVDDKIDGVVIMLVDVEKIKRSREYAENIIATIRESLLVLDENLRVLKASRSFYDTFKATPEETEGRLLYDLGAGQLDIPELRRLLSEVVPHNDSFEEFEVERVFERIGPRSLLLDARRLFQESGQSILILLTIQDITERKALQDRIQELVAADRLKNELLALLAHELRNPLAPLRNAVQLLEMPEIDRSTLDQARDMMSRQIKNMSRLIEDLLDVSRVTQGKTRLRREQVELVALLRRTVDLVRHHLEARGQELSLCLPDEPIPLEGDPTRLEQVFGNLLDNASKFTPQGGHIRLSAEIASLYAETDGDPDQQVVVRIRDDGIGIAPEMLPRVFDLFVQAQSSLDRSQGGLGIGLTLVRTLVELHGGTIEAHSEGLGKGSELVVRLPFEPQMQYAGIDTAGRKHSADGSSPRRILVVDDNVDTAQSMALLLRLKGHRVEVAHDGPAALETARSFEPEVVLLDIGLPGLDGYEVAKRLREETRLSKALLVALTGYGQEEDRRRARHAGFDHHFTKPVDPAVLYQLIAGAPDRRYERPEVRS